MRARSDTAASPRLSPFKEGSYMELRNLPWGKIALGLGMAGVAAVHPAFAQEAATARIWVSTEAMFFVRTRPP